MKTLVTGATGFIGSHLVEGLLHSGHKVRAMIRKQPQDYHLPWLSDGRVEIVTGDISNATDVARAVNNIDVVFHLAAMLGTWGIPEETYHKVNVLATREFINQSLRAGVNHFIYISTVGVMGRLKSTPADIDHPYAPVSLYEKSKCEAESWIRQAVTEVNFPATIVRPSHVYGPRDRNTAKLFKTMKLIRVFPVIGGGYCLYQPVYVDDMVQALISCMGNKMALGKTYIVAGSEAITFREFFHLSIKTMGDRIALVSFPVSLARLAAGFSERVGKIIDHEPPLTYSRIDFFSYPQTYNVARIQEDTGFKPRIGIEDGLKRTIKWYRDNGWL